MEQVNMGESPEKFDAKKEEKKRRLLPNGTFSELTDQEYGDLVREWNKDNQ
jgi:hypothetical protein